MDSDIRDFMKDILDFEIETQYHFRTVCGFTFAFESNDTYINHIISTSTIRPVGIIYEENDEYYFAPLSDDIKINEIIKDFVEKVII